MKSIVYIFVATLFTILYFFVIVLTYLLTALFDRERVAIHYASKVWSLGVYRLNPWWRIRVTGQENITQGEKYVVVVNHQSMMDIPIMYVLPFNFKWVSKQEAYKIPIFGQVIRMHGDIVVKRGSASSAKKMMTQCATRLSNGTSVIIFPEGTRSHNGEIGEFKDGAFRLAKSSGVAILPCVITGTGSVANGWRLQMPFTFKVQILPPLSAAQVAGSEPKAVANKVREMMVEVNDN